MAKWIYERWEPKWPEATGSTLTISANDVIRIYNFDMTYESTTFNNASIGDVFFLTLGGNIYQKYSSSSCRLYDSQPSPIKATFIDTIVAEEGTVPDDGIHTDGYWYVKLKPAFPTMRILRDGQWIEVETGYVLKDGIWKPIEEIYKLQDGQWVQA